MKKIFIILTACILICLLVSSCQNAAPTAETQRETTDASTQAATETPTVEDTVAETQAKTQEETEAETEIEIAPVTEMETEEETVYIPADSERTVYVDLSESGIERHMTSSFAFDMQSEGDLFSIPKAQRVDKTNIPDLKVATSDGEQSFSYHYSMANDDAAEMIQRFIVYDCYKSNSGDAEYHIREDGKLEYYTAGALPLDGERATVTREQTLEIAKAFVLSWYGAEFPLDEYEATVKRIKDKEGVTPKRVVYFEKTFYGYDVGDRCEVHINTDGQVSMFVSYYFGIGEYLSHIKDEQVKNSESFLDYAISAANCTPHSSTIDMQLGRDGELYFVMCATGWTYNEMGMIDENSCQLGLVFSTPVIP